MLPWNYGFHWNLGHIVFLGAFYLVLMTVAATLIAAARRSRRALLNRRVLSQMVHAADSIGFRNAPQRHVAGANRTHLALTNEAVESRHGFFERRFPVVTMRKINIDRVCLQALEAFLALPLNLLGAQPS